MKKFIVQLRISYEREYEFEAKDEHEAEDMALEESCSEFPATPDDYLVNATEIK